MQKAVLTPIDAHIETARRTKSPSKDRGFPLVPEEGVEPTRPCGQRILSPPRLPFRHSGALVWQLYLTE
jgi:hypothetical protein